MSKPSFSLFFNITKISLRLRWDIKRRNAVQTEVRIPLRTFIIYFDFRKGKFNENGKKRLLKIRLIPFWS